MKRRIAAILAALLAAAFCLGAAENLNKGVVEMG